MKKPIKIVSLIIAVLAFIGVIVFVSTGETLSLKFTVLIIGIWVGIFSTLVERKSKILFNSSVIILIIGLGIIEAYEGYMNPMPVYQWDMVTNIGSFYVGFSWYISHNIFAAFLTVLSGPAVIGPYIQLNNILSYFGFLTELMSFYGFKGAILFFGWLNLYPELTAFFLATMAGIRVTLESFQAFIYLRNDFLNSLRRIRDAIVREIVNTMPKVVVLLIIAAVLETLWIPFWINYWLQYIL